MSKHFLAKKEHKELVETIKGSWKLSGLTVPNEVVRYMEQVHLGLITTDEAIEEVLKRYR